MFGRIALHSCCPLQFFVCRILRINDRFQYERSAYRRIRISRKVDRPYQNRFHRHRTGCRFTAVFGGGRHGNGFDFRNTFLGFDTAGAVSVIGQFHRGFRVGFPCHRFIGGIAGLDSCCQRLRFFSQCNGQCCPVQRNSRYRYPFRCHRTRCRFTAVIGGRRHGESLFRTLFIGRYRISSVFVFGDRQVSFFRGKTPRDFFVVGVYRVERYRYIRRTAQRQLLRCR